MFSEHLQQGVSQQFRSSLPKLLLEKLVLKICSSQNVISIKLPCNKVFSCKFFAYFENTFQYFYRKYLSSIIEHLAVLFLRSYLSIFAQHLPLFLRTLFSNFPKHLSVCLQSTYMYFWGKPLKNPSSLFQSNIYHHFKREFLNFKVDIASNIYLIS